MLKYDIPSRDVREILPGRDEPLPFQGLDRPVGRRLRSPHQGGELPRACQRDSDRDKAWRIIYRVDEDAIVITDVFLKKTGATPRSVIDVARERLRRYDRSARGG